MQIPITSKQPAVRSLMLAGALVFSTATAAQAFGLGDIVNGAKKAAKVTVEVVKVTREAAKTPQKIKSKVVNSLHDATGGLAGRLYGEAARHTVGRLRTDLSKEAIDEIVNDYENVGRSIPGYLRGASSKAKGWVKGEIKRMGRDMGRGSYRPRRSRSAAPPRPAWDRPVGKAKALVRKPGLAPGSQKAPAFWGPVPVSKRIESRPQRAERPKRLSNHRGRQAGNDRSIWGRPVFAPPGTSGRKVQGLKRENLKPHRSSRGRDVVRDLKRRSPNSFKRKGSKREMRRDRQSRRLSKPRRSNRSSHRRRGRRR